MNPPLNIAWIPDYPLEWMQEVPPPLRALPRRHPATWEMVLLSEFEKDPGLRLHVISLRGRIEKDVSFEQKGVHFHVLKCPPWLRVASLFVADTILIRRLCKKVQPDLIHAWGMEKGAGLIAQRLGYPYVLTVQGLFAWYKQQVPLARYDRFIERLERYSLPRAPVVTTESAFAVGFLKDRYPRLRVHQAEHAPNHSFFQVQRRPNREPIQFCSIGGLGHRKGTDLLFKALDRLTPAMPFKVKIICGPDPDYITSLRATVSPALWDRVEFKHHILPHEVARELETPVALLMPTRADVSPNAVKEAVVAGVPVVASEVGGIPDYVQPGQNGFLFPGGNLEEFIKSIRALARHPLFGRGEVEPASLARSREYLSPARMARNFIGAYEMALDSRSKRNGGRME